MQTRPLSEFNIYAVAERLSSIAHPKWIQKKETRSQQKHWQLLSTSRTLATGSNSFHPAGNSELPAVTHLFDLFREIGIGREDLIYVSSVQAGRCRESVSEGTLDLVLKD